MKKPVRLTSFAQGKRKLAIFDIDGTIFRSSLVRELLNSLIREGVFSKSVEKEVEKDYLAWVNRQGDYENYIWKVVDLYTENIGGKYEKDVSAVVKKTISSEKNKLYRFTRDLLKDLKKQNYFLLAISGSPSFIVSEFARQLKFDHYFGSEYEVKKGIFTGKVLRGGWLDKTVLLNKFKQTHRDIDFSSSIGIGDTQSDIPLLEIVGNPIAFNPNMELAKYAKRKGWRIIVERKDVIYDIKDFKIISSKSKT